MTLLRRSVLLSLFLTLAPGAARAQAPANCALANAVDSGTYANLTISTWSEVDQDNASYNWAECRAAALRRTLTGNPKLSARIDTLRRQYREMRAIESELAGTRAGGGTMYAHAVPRSFAFLEEQIGSLAALARSPLGGQTGALYARRITRRTSRPCAATAPARTRITCSSIRLNGRPAWTGTRRSGRRSCSRSAAAMTPPPRPGTPS